MSRLARAHPKAMAVHVRIRPRAAEKALFGD